MKTRVGLVVIALLLALAATAGSVVYLQSLKNEVIRSGETIEVLVAQQAVGPGKTLEEMLNKGQVKLSPVPRRYVVDGAITDPKGLGGRVVAAGLAKGEQLTEQKLRQAGGGDLSSRVPQGFVALSIPVDEVTGVGNGISAGDKVMVLVTFSPGPGGVDTTRILLKNTDVIEVTSAAAGSQKSLGQGGSAAKKTITLAVSPENAERLVFAEETGHVWVTLQPVGDTQTVETSGQTVESVFR